MFFGKITFTLLQTTSQKRNFARMNFNPDFASVPLDRAATVAFTGHRSYDGSAAGQLARTVRALYARGYRTFLSGMAPGFDLAAAEAVLEMAGECPGIGVVAVIPFAGHIDRQSEADRRRYRRILEHAADVVTLADRYTPRAYFRRNDFLVDNASYVVSWHDGSIGCGTGYTVSRARRCHLPVENLYPDPQQNLPLD